MYSNKKPHVSLLLKNTYPLACLLSGLIVAQTIATAQVYFSNEKLYTQLKIITSAGYLAIPNQHIMDRLRDFGPAFYGGLFFTLSLGAALSMTAWGLSWIRIRVFPRKTWFLPCLLIPLPLALLLINFHGFVPFASAYFLFIPLAVFWTTRKLMPTTPRKHGLAFTIIHPLLILLLGISWVWQMDGNIFMSVRDNLLLTSTSGREINGFYYRYAFYPAEVFKPLDRKTLKTCLITGAESAGLKESLGKKLLENDYLPVENTPQVDLVLMRQGKEIQLQQHGNTEVSTTVPDFLAMGSIHLKEFSKKADQYVFFRKCVFLSLLTGLPAMGYLFLFLLVRLFSGLFLGPEASAYMASFVCFCMGLTLLTAVTPIQDRRMPGKTLDQMLESKDARERISALKKILDKRAEISNYDAYKKLLRSPHIEDRYWLTKTLAFSHNPETLKDLLAMLDDPSPNVVSMTFWALGFIGDRSVQEEILKRLPDSKVWYTQWYAYNALRNLGWMQTKLFFISDCESGSDPYLLSK